MAVFAALPDTKRSAIKINDAQTGTRPGDPDHFTGEVWMDGLTHPDVQNGLSVIKVHSAPRARAGWHRHPPASSSM